MNLSFKSIEGVNNINTVLIIISAVLAYIMPFELFLLAYAVLGPLHYLTEISWLNEKSYFVKHKKDVIILVIIVLLLLLGYLSKSSPIKTYSVALLFTGFMLGGILVFVKNLQIKVALGSLLFASAVIFHFEKIKSIMFLFGVFLPTIIHVFVFTAMFVLYGALKGNSKSGYISLIVLILCSISFFIYIPEEIVPATEYAKKSYGGFAILNRAFDDLLGKSMTGWDDFYHSTQGVSIMRFIAFAYLYHYLNWFSKTSVIKWLDISNSRVILIAGVWILSIFLYALDYNLGFKWLYLLSMLHVFLEFPLNHITGLNIFKEIKAKFA